MNNKDFFQKHLGQTTPFPFLIEVEKAEGTYIWDKNGKKYIDMIAGVAVNNIGNRHPKVVERIQEQLDKYLHVMVYGEFVQEVSIEFTKKLLQFLPEELNAVYTVNSGTEANEAALKLAKRFTNRTELIAFKGAYHGNTHGSMSVSHNEIKKSAFRPLLPDVNFISLNDFNDLEKITSKTAGVILEPIQGDAGVRMAEKGYLCALQKRCREQGTLLIFDEIQCGLGRSGKMFAFEHSGIVPDILVLGKALGGGLPIGAFITRQKIMHELSHSPMLGHITTFGGNPLITAAALGCLEAFEKEISMSEVEEKGKYLASFFENHSLVKAIRYHGLMFAVDLPDVEKVNFVVNRLLEKGIISFWFLSHPYSFRLSPPLNISFEDLKVVGEKIKETFDELV